MKIKGEKTMQERQLGNNNVTISGEIVSDFIFNHEMHREKFYNANLSILRKSGIADIIPITVSERLVNGYFGWKGQCIQINGQLRSYNKWIDGRSHLILSVFVKDFEETGELIFEENKNYIFLDGFICKPPIYKKTPLGREIADALIAVNRPHNKNDYIPCIFWGGNARYASSLDVGTHISLEGRIQSREYFKRISEAESEKRVTYEVSASKVEVLEEQKVEGSL